MQSVERRPRPAVLSLGLLLFLPASPAAGQDADTAPELAQEAVPTLVAPPIEASLRWADWSGDGLVDAWAVQPDGSGLLLQNDGQGHFKDVTASSGLAEVRGVHSAVWADVDGDGLLDLYLLSWTDQSRLFLQASVGDFVDITDASGLGAEDRPVRAEWLDFDGDGRADLHLVALDRDVLYRGLPDARFERVDLGLLDKWMGVNALGAVPGAVAGQPALRPPSPTSAAAGASGTGSPIGPFSAAAGAALVCAGSIEDQAGGACLEASSTPQLGLLYPISQNLFVAPGTGFVGINTTSPTARLTVDGDVRATRFVSTVGPGTAPFSVVSTTRVDRLNADRVDGLEASAFRLNAALITGADIANGTILDEDVSVAAAIAGTKISPNFGDQIIRTTNRAGIGIAFNPNSGLQVSAPTGENVFRAQAAGLTKLLVASNGGVSVGANISTPPPNGLYVNGDLGVGLTAPNHRVDVSGDINASGALRQGGQVKVSPTGRFFAPDTGWPDLAYNMGTSGLGMGVPSANNLALNTLGIERLRVTQAGFVGIGVTNPGFRLDLPNFASASGRGRANAWTTYSSRRWKENVETIENGLDLVLQLRGVTFDWTAETGGERDDIGFIAEEVGAVVPELVTWEDDGVHAKSLKYDRISALNVEAIKAQHALIEALEADVREERERRLTAERRIVELERDLEDQRSKLDRVGTALGLWTPED